MAYMKDHISIIMPAYNARKYIRESILSVLDQTYPNWELIIVDDCSTDETPQLLRDMEKRDARIRVFYEKENKGAAVARNKALQQARGQFIAFLDSDDCWKRNKLAVQIAFMKQYDVAFTFTAYEYISKEGIPLRKKVSAPIEVTYQDLLKNTIVGCLTVMINREQTGDIQMPAIRTRQDLATWLSILKKGYKAFGINEVLAEYRVGNDSISANKWKAAQKTWFVYREIERLNLLKATWCFSHYAFYAVRKRL
ncbi:glycosyltransferase family 2 protein [Niallia sp. NCCP-28]|uniref:teichuronic acid biosynthesis protein TuaG n=1 Tax=Niallia sp. NCCP-28 TaxID=2934712 RepID=UPI00208658F4|nr:putative teichuronic acid biosynthesis glycosyltransferase TuaG [Niallia sp. NCCP-28]